MRGLVYTIAAIAGLGIMIVIATRPSDQPSEPTSSAASVETITTESSDVIAKTTSVPTDSVTIAVPEMHCEFACFPRVKETLESAEGVETVELGPQKEEGAIDNRQVIVKFKPGFDVNDALARLTKEGFKNSDVVQ